MTLFKVFNPLRQFEHIVNTELTPLFDSFDLDKKVREKVIAYVEKMQRWMAGVLRWHQTVDRYKEFELFDAAIPKVQDVPPAQKRPLGSLTGLGTSAARIVEMMHARRSTATPRTGKH